MNRLRYLLYLILALSPLALVYGPRVAPPAPSASYVMGRGPTIVLVHGLGSQVVDWYPVARRLARHFRVVFVDLPGQGASDLQRITLERARMSLDAVLAAEHDPVVLVGHSLGGLLCADEALARPEHVRGLVLIETALRPQFEGDDATALRAALDSSYDDLIASAYRSFGRDSAQGERLYEEARQVAPSVMRAWIELSLDSDLSQAVGNLKMPVLTVLSDRSWEPGEAWIDVSRALGYDRIPEVQAARVRDSGHFVMLDHPETVARLIERFASRPESQPVALR